MKFLEAANNFTKSVRPAKNFMKLVDWKLKFRCLKVFAYLTFTCVNILIAKHMFCVTFVSLITTT